MVCKILCKCCISRERVHNSHQIVKRVHDPKSLSITIIDTGILNKILAVLIQRSIKRDGQVEFILVKQE